MLAVQSYNPESKFVIYFTYYISTFIHLRCKGTGLQIISTVFLLVFSASVIIIIRMVRWEAIYYTDWRFEFITLDIPYLDLRQIFLLLQE